MLCSPSTIVCSLRSFKCLQRKCPVIVMSCKHLTLPCLETNRIFNKKKPLCLVSSFIDASQRGWDGGGWDGVYRRGRRGTGKSDPFVQGCTNLQSRGVRNCFRSPLYVIVYESQLTICMLSSVHKVYKSQSKRVSVQ